MCCLRDKHPMAGITRMLMCWFGFFSVKSVVCFGICFEVIFFFLEHPELVGVLTFCMFLLCLAFLIALFS